MESSPSQAKLKSAGGRNLLQRWVNLLLLIFCLKSDDFFLNVYTFGYSLYFALQGMIVIYTFIHLLPPVYEGRSVCENEIKKAELK